jgi:hypothetical protein
MTTAELEKLILEAAPGMRELLGRDGDSLAVWGELGLLPPDRHDNAWRVIDYDGGGFVGRMPNVVALSALVEFWRDRLEKEHGVIFVRCNKTRWAALDNDGSGCLWGGKFKNQIGWLGKDCGDTWETLPEAIVAAVHALAKEKRGKGELSEAGRKMAEQVVENRMKREEVLEDKCLKPAPSPSPAAIRAALRYLRRFGDSVGPLDAITRELAAIIGQEFHKEAAPSTDITFLHIPKQDPAPVPALAWPPYSGVISAERPRPWEEPT